MKNVIYIIVFSAILIISFSCKSKTVYVPVESVKTEKEYIDKWHRDSIHVYDSVFLAHKNDTVFLEKYKYIYKDKMVRDSVFITDSVRVEVLKPVEVDVPYYPKWLVGFAMLGLLTLLYLLNKVFRFF